MEGAAEASEGALSLQPPASVVVETATGRAHPSARPSHVASCCRLHKEVSAGTHIGERWR